MTFRTNLKQSVLIKWTVAVVILVLLAGGSVYLFYYTQAFIPVMNYVYESGGVPCWEHNCPVTFFPFPHVEIPEVWYPVQVYFPLNSIDQFIYRFFLTTGLIFGITLIWWIGTLCYSFLLTIKGLRTLQKVSLANEDKKIN